MRREDQAEWRQFEEAAEPRRGKTVAATLPLLFTLVVLLLSPFLYDLVRWLQRLFRGG